MNIRDEIITGSYAIGETGKEPLDWKEYALKLEAHIADLKTGVFGVLGELNRMDSKNGTRLVAVSTNFVEGHKVKQGAKITMGAEEQSLLDLFNDKAMPILLIVDKDEFFKRDKKATTPAT